MSTGHGPPRTFSRTRPPEVPAVLHAGVRYEQLMAPGIEGLPPGGYLTATDVRSGERLWTARVYETVLIKDLETDVQIVFFRSMQLTPNGETLLVENERGQRFGVSTIDGTVSALP